MKIRTEYALIGELHIKQFVFETYKKNNKSENIEHILDCLNKCNKISISKNKWYRARIVNKNDEDIIYNKQGIPIRGYLADKSGVAPARCIKPGRANDKCEQVLYVAEDEETAQKEIRTEVGTYVSLASCNFSNDIMLIDFSPYTEKQLSNYINENFNTFQSEAYMFIYLQKILTMPEYTQDHYIISRKLVKCIKENINVSGMIYISHLLVRKILQFGMIINLLNLQMGS